MKKLIIIILFLLAGCSLQPKITEQIFGADLSTLSEKYNQATEIKAKYSLEDSTLVRNKIINPELDKYKGEPKDEVKVIIGGKTDLLGADKIDFEPSIQLSRWNEVNFKIKPNLTGIASKDKVLSFNGDKIRFDTPKISFEMYDYTEGESGYKYIWYLNEKPTTNKVEFQIESEGLDFFYQPPLTEEYQSGYNEEFQREVVVTETQVKDLDGNVLVERPENVVGSYAVYHQTKGRMNDINGKEYKTGQAFFIYKSRLTDAEGKQEWAILNIDTEKGTFTEEIPQDFLDKAVYPIKGNANFGYETAGGTNYYAADAIIGSYWMGAAGTVTTMTVSIKSATGGAPGRDWKVGIYKQSDSTLVIGGPNETQYTATQAWKISDIDDTAITAQNYWLVFWALYNPDYTSTYYNTTGNGGYYSYAYNVNWPSSTTMTSQDRSYSIYATYTEGGATYCGHTRGDWYVNSDCYISTSTTTNGFIYIGTGGQLHCVDGATISAKGLKGKGGTKATGDQGCKFKLWKPI